MKWEYLSYRYTPAGFFSGKVKIEDLTLDLNGFGRDGWELVSTFDTNRHDGETKDVLFIFKRPIG
jgi:hypothetical protein